MKRSHAFALIGIAAAALAGLSLSGTARFHTKCDSLAMTSNLERRFEVDVPTSELHKFNAQLVSYLEDKGFTFETSENADFLSPPDSNMKQSKYLNIKTIGCNYRTIIWSENSRAKNEFVITVHSTVFGSNNSTQRVIAELEEIISKPI